MQSIEIAKSILPVDLGEDYWISRTYDSKLRHIHIRFDLAHDIKGDDNAKKLSEEIRKKMEGFSDELLSFSSWARVDLDKGYQIGPITDWKSESIKRNSFKTFTGECNGTISCGKQILFVNAMYSKSASRGIITINIFDNDMIIFELFEIYNID
jgi:hypothetical protein